MQIATIWPPRIRNPRRVWAITGVVQLIDRFAFICIWGYLCLSTNVLMKINLLGHGPWLDIGIYLAIALLRISFVVQAILRPESWPSKAWFELLFHCVVIGIDTDFIVRLAQGIPSQHDFQNNFITQPFDQASLILFSLAFTCLSLDILVSIMLSLTILTAASSAIFSHQTWRWWRHSVWAVLAGTDEEGGLSRRRRNPAHGTQRGFTFKDVGKDFIIMLRAFLDDYTVYRRTPGVEPVCFNILSQEGPSPSPCHTKLASQMFSGG